MLKDRVEPDYYALLGVPRGSSSDAIRARFLTLSREFHPDRRRDDASLVAAANAQYTALDRAYKVLCDPIKRRAYDVYGERGVLILEQQQEQQNALGAHLETADELQRYMEQLLRRNNQQALEAQFSSFSEMSMGVDASDLVQAPMQGLRSLFQRGSRYVARSDMAIHQRAAIPLSRHTTLTLGGYVSSGKIGLAMGGFTTQLAHASPDPSAPSFTLSSELSWTPKLHCQISQPVSARTVFMLIPELDDEGLDISVGANQLLTPQLHGAMMWSTRDGLSASLSQDTATYSAATAVAVNGAGPNVSFQLRRALMAATTAKVSLRASLMMGLSFVAGASREISDRTRVALGVMLARAGVTLRVGFTRGSVRFVVPIFLSPFSAQSAFSTFCAATSPFVVAAVVTQLVKPAQERKRRLELQHRHDMLVQYLATARQSALEQQKLMLRCAKEKVEQERQREDGKGLVVLLARYGKNPTSPDSREPRGDDLDVALRAMREQGLNREIGDDAENGSGDNISQQEAEAALLEQRWIDVTVPLRFFVKDGALSLNSSSKAGLLGFYNPCVREDLTIADARSSTNSAVKPLLYVRYAYDGQVFEATFDDDQAVSLPSQYAYAMGPVGSVY